VGRGRERRGNGRREMGKKVEGEGGERKGEVASPAIPIAQQ
jgi:hypothetical protein